MTPLLERACTHLYEEETELLNFNLHHEMKLMKCTLVLITLHIKH